MSRRKKSPRRNKAKRRTRNTPSVPRPEDVVNDTAARFTCAAETADDFAYQCLQALETLDIDLLFHRLALEIWNQHPTRAPELLAALEELLSERLRHRETLQRLERRLQGLADDPDYHIHLEPLDAYRELVRSRLYPSASST